MFNAKFPQSLIDSDGAPALICELQRATVLPLSTGSSPATIKGGVKNLSMDTKFHQSRWENIFSDTPEFAVATDVDFLRNWQGKCKTRKGKYLYGGPVFKHFGHFLAESIHRVWAFDFVSKTTNDRVKKVIFLPQNTKQLSTYRQYLYKLPPSYISTLSYLGVPENKIKIQFSPTTYDTLIVPQQASFFRAQQPINHSYKDFLLECESRNGISSNLKLHKKLYVSRANFSLRGAFAGESCLEKIFERNGYHIFYPEKHSINEQLKYYKNAEQIVFAEGSALHVLELLGELQAHIFVIARRAKSRAVFKGILEARVSDFSFFNAVVTLPSLFFREGQKMPAQGSAISVLDTETLFTYLDKILGLRFAPSDIERFRLAVFQDVCLYYQHYTAAVRKDDKVKLKVMENFKIQLSKVQNLTDDFL